MAVDDPGKSVDPGSAPTGAAAGVERPAYPEISEVLFEAIPDCVVIAVRKGTREIVAANSAARKLGAAPGKICYEVFGGRRVCPFCRAPESWETAGSLRDEVEYGGCYYDVTWAPYSDDLYLNLIFDVTDRKSVEAALRESEERYRRLADNYPNGTVNVYDRDLRMTFVAGQDLQKYGRAPEEFVGKTFQELSPPEAFAIAEPHLRAAFEGRTGSYETPYWGDRYYLVNVAPLYDADGRINEILVATHNVSERKRAEDDLRERTEELRRSQRLESVGILAGGIAHDFNNLLAAIVGQTELLKDTPCTTAEYADGLEVIRAAAFRAAELTRQLLAFSRRQPLQPRVLDLNQVAESMAGLLERVLGEDVELVFREGRDLWPVEADPSQLEQVIMNLAVNAREAMPGGGRLTIETANDEPHTGPTGGGPGIVPGRHVRLSVSDTGSGMDEDTLSRMFEPFFTTKEPGKGTGLGLSTVYGIVKQSGGDIGVWSRPGEGSVFTVYLPRSDRPVDWTPGAGESRPPSTLGGGETIMVVEDEAAVRVLTARILRQAGYRVVEAGDPAEALAVFDAGDEEVALVLTDVVLPGQSGTGLADALAQRQGVTPRVLFMSGYTFEAMVHDGRLDPGVLFLEKPFTRDGLLSAVRSALDGP